MAFAWTEISQAMLQPLSHHVLDMDLQLQFYERSCYVNKAILGPLKVASFELVKIMWTECVPSLHALCQRYSHRSSPCESMSIVIYVPIARRRRSLFAILILLFVFSVEILWQGILVLFLSFQGHRVNKTWLKRLIIPFTTIWPEQTLGAYTVQATRPPQHSLRCKTLQE